MPIVVKERFLSPTNIVRAGGQSGSEKLFTVRGTSDFNDAFDALLAFAPADHDGYPLLVPRLERTGEDSWFGNITYGPRQGARAEVGDSTYEFDTTGGTQRIFQSIATVDAQGISPSSTVPDFQRAIGVTNDSVEGVDITVPVYGFSERRWMDASTVNTAYRLALADLTGKVNNATFRDFAAGEVLFLGARGAQRGIGGDWELSFSFARSPNVTGLEIGDLEPVNKGGWEYLWVLYDEIEDTSAKRLVKRPGFVYVEQVYTAGDFSVLGL